jgi:predicted HD phosphohydrolase
VGFTRLDASTSEQRRAVGEGRAQDPDRLANHLLALIRSLEQVVDGHSVNMLTHSLQTATRAERAGADDDVVLAALCHDAGHLYADDNHGRVAAEMLRGFVRPRTHWAVKVHRDFTTRYWVTGLAGRLPRWRHAARPGYRLARRMVDEWDQTSFDPDYDHEPLEHFEPLVRRLMARPSFARPSRVRRYVAGAARRLERRAG